MKPYGIKKVYYSMDCDSKGSERQKSVRSTEKEVKELSAEIISKEYSESIVDDLISWRDGIIL